MSMKNVDDCIVLHSKAWLVRDGYQVVNMYMLVKFVNVQVNIVASSTGRTRREPRLSGYATLAPLTTHDYESCL